MKELSILSPLKYTHVIQLYGVMLRPLGEREGWGEEGERGEREGEEEGGEERERGGEGEGGGGRERKGSVREEGGRQKNWNQAISRHPSVNL